MRFLKNLFSFSQVSVTRYFAVFSVSIIVFTIAVYFYLNQKIYKESAINALKNQSLRVEKSLIDSMDYSAYLMKYLGDQVKENDPENLRYIEKLLSSFKLHRDINNETPWNMFSWVNTEKSLVVNSDKGLVKPIDLRYRKYIREAFTYPDEMILGKPTFGLVSNDWIVPSAMAISGKSGHKIGALVFGFKISKMKDKLWRATTDDDVAFAIFDYDMDPIIVSDRFVVDPEMKSLVSSALNSPYENGKLKEFSFFGQNENYGYYQKMDKYSYIIITKFEDDSYFNNSLKKQLYSYVSESWAFFFVLGVIFYLLKIAIFRPITQLARASELIALDRDEEAVMPKTRIKELAELSRQLATIEKHKAEIVHAKKSQERFFANMSHELRTPLNGILNFSSMMEQEMFGEIGEDYKEMSRDIHSSGTHLLNLVNDILDFSKMDIGKVSLHEEEFDLEKEVIEAVKIVSSDRKKDDHITISYHIKGVEVLYADRRMVKQILLNLLSNASKFTDSGEISLNIFVEDDKLIIEVRDTGIGIRQEDLAKLVVEFGQVGDGYYRGKKQGSGLGLFLVRKMAELHKGQFTINSVYGQGTVVRVTLPSNRIVK